MSSPERSIGALDMESSKSDQTSKEGKSMALPKRPEEEETKPRGGHALDDEEEAKARAAAKEFTPSKGLTTAEAEELMRVHGKNELEEKRVPKWLIFLKQLWGPMPIMIWAAIIIMAGIQSWPDFGILCCIQLANATIGWYETTKAGDAVAALKASLKPQATVKRDGKFQPINATLLVPGDLVLLGAGSAVPADCIVNEGQIDVDQAALTGESLPVTMFRGDQPKMGSTVTRGEVEGTVEFTGKNTFFGKTATMIQGVGDGELGNLQKILMRVMIVLCGLSLVLCIIALVYLIVGLDVKVVEALKFTVVLLVASIPVAIEIVCTTTLALGSRQLSSHGAIVTRLTAIEETAGMNMLCSDKTGTLTKNKMVIQDDCPTYMEGMDQMTVLKLGALAAKWKEPPRDALDTMVLGQADLPALDVYEQIEFMPFDPTVKRTEGTLRGPDGKVFKTTKGAPHIILKLVQVNKDRVSQLVEAKVMELGERGIRSLAVAKTNDEGLWEMAGILTFLDPPRDDTKRTIERAMEFGVDVKMITGDHTVIAKETCRQLGLGTNIMGPEGLPTMDAEGKVPENIASYGKMIMEADGFAQVYPEHKYLIVESLRKNGFAVGMTGDGVNDAPALKRADVGIAVQGATDAARAAADIVLTEEGLSVVVEAIIIARRIFQRIKTFMTYRIAATLQLVCFFFIALFAMDPKDYWTECMEKYNLGVEKCGEEWPEFFSIPVIMLMLITLLNDGTLISIAYDTVNPSPRPEKWNLKVLFFIASILGAVACASSLLLLWGALDSHNPDGMFHKFGLPGMAYGQIVTLMYMKVSLSDFLTLYSARTIGWFWSSRPGNLLMGLCVLSLLLSTLLATFWPTGEFEHVPTMGLARKNEQAHYTLWALWVWIYCIVWWFIQDAAKVVAYYFINKYDLLAVQSAPLLNIRDAITVKDKPLGRASVGYVEEKVLNMKVENATNALEHAARKNADSTLSRASQQMALVRNSIQLARNSATRGATLEEVEAGVQEVRQMVESVEAAVERAAPGLPADQRAEIEEQMGAVRRTAERFAEVTTKLA